MKTQQPQLVALGIVPLPNLRKIAGCSASILHEAEPQRSRSLAEPEEGGYICRLA